MNIGRLSWQNILSNPLNTLLSLMLMTFGVGIISLLLLLNNQIEQQLKNNVRGIDMVVGAKGSPLQIILSSIYHVDNPTGNISYKEANELNKNPMVDLTIPLSFGDSYKGFRIVGSTLEYPKLFQANLKEGEFWNHSMEVVVGSIVAEVNDLKIGDYFQGTHGLLEEGHVHDDYNYKVVGILNQSNSTIDKLILTNLESVWRVHGYETEMSVSDDHEHHNCDHHDHSHIELQEENDTPNNISDESMITSMLVKFRSPVGLIQIPRKINETTNLQAAVPAFEINRLTSLLGFGVQTLNTIALIIIIVSGMSIFISLYNSLKKRRYELALMRVHGANKWQLVRLVLLEGLILSVWGTFLGLLVSRITLLSMSYFVEHKHTISTFQFNLINEELWLFPTAIFIGLFASLIPTILTYKINIPKTLSNA